VLNRAALTDHADRLAVAWTKQPSCCSIETAIPPSRPERSKAAGRSGGQGCQKGTAPSRPQASLTAASTTAASTGRGEIYLPPDIHASSTASLGHAVRKARVTGETKFRHLCAGFHRR